jgi:hypothetical protein
MGTFDALGLGDGIVQVWNVIPFSFLVDYFLSVDSFLEQFERQMLVLPVRDSTMSYSIKSDTLATVIVDEVGRGACITRKKTFIRKLYPVPLTTGNWSDISAAYALKLRFQSKLSDSKFLNVVALILAQLRY